MKNQIVLKTSLFFISLFFNLLNFQVCSQEKYIIVLDIQDFPKKSDQLKSSVNEMVLNVNSIINHFKAENVIYIKAAGKALNISLKRISVDTLPALAFDSSLSIVSNNVFTKIQGDAFSSAELMNFLKSRKAEKIVLVGLMAEKCIYDTALGGKEKGFDMMIIPEGIVGTTPKKKSKAISKMQDKGIKFISMADVTGLL